MRRPRIACPLSRQCFHALDIQHANVRLRAVRRGNWHLVEVDIRGLRAGEASSVVRVTTAEYDNVVAAGVVIDPVYARHETYVVFGVQRATFFEHRLGHGRNTGRNFLQVQFAFGRRNDDLVQRASRHTIFLR